MIKFVDINCASSPDAAMLEEFVDWIMMGKVKGLVVTRHPGRSDDVGEPIVRFQYDEIE